MMTSLAPTDDAIAVDHAPAIAGLRFRRFRDNCDFERMAAVINGSKAADGIERVASADSLRRFYVHRATWRPARDMVYAEVDGQVIGYGAVLWDEGADGARIYQLVGFVLPAWRRMGIGRALLRHGERRLRAIDADNPTSSPRFFEASAADSETAKAALLRSEGYAAVRYANQMLRSLAEPIPSLALPTGLGLRDVLPAHHEAIRLASNEAFRDHWGDVPVSVEQFRAYVGHPDFDPALWLVAWDGPEVAGMTLGSIDRAQNAEYKRQRGWVYSVAVRRPWRGRGLARALLARSMHAFRDRGITEVGLSVDTENLSGALRLYEGLGFKPIKRIATYRKPLDRK